MKKTVKIFAVLLAVIMLAGCTALPEFSYSEGVEGLLGSLTELFGDFSDVSQTEVIITEETIDTACYSRLTDSQQRIYRLLLTVSEKMINGWIKLGLCEKNYSEDISLAYRAMTSDYPEIFWMPNTYLLRNIGSRARPNVLIAFDYSGDGKAVGYTVSKAERDSMRQELESAAEAIVSEGKAKKNLFETELFFHDYICERASYVAEGDALIYTAYGALISGEAVCEGYSRAMQLLCDKAGIPCVLIYGKSEGMGHMWNLVNPDGSWYHLDVTWDDNEGLLHTYFNMTDAEISNDHEIWQLYTPGSGSLPDEEMGYNLIKYECNASNAGYFNYFGLTLDKNYFSAAKLISESDKAGKNTMQLKIINAEVLKAFSEDYNRPVAKLQRQLSLMGSGVNINGIAQLGDIVTFYW